MGSAGKRTARDWDPWNDERLRIDLTVESYRAKRGEVLREACRSQRCFPGVPAGSRIIGVVSYDRGWLRRSGVTREKDPPNNANAMDTNTRNETSIECLIMFYSNQNKFSNSNLA